MEALILKTGALGDVLRTTSILPGLHARHPGLRVTWLTAPAAVELVAHHPGVARVLAVDPGDERAVDAVGDELAALGPWGRVLSLDDEVPLCRLAARLVAGAGAGVLSGAFLDGDRRRYTADVAPWFDMGLLSVHGKAEADRRKVANRESHAAIYARMLGIEPGEPRLPLTDEARAFAQGWAARSGLRERGAVVGLNTGAGGRWESKRLAVGTTCELMGTLHGRLDGRVTFLVLGGPDERRRNDEILARARAEAPEVRAVDAGTDHPLMHFAGLVDGLDLLITSDSLALHVAVARAVPVVAFFAPTSAAEIELYGRGRKVVSTAPDYCSYRPDADTSTITTERLAAAALELLSAARG